MPLDPYAIRNDFPLLRRKINGKPITYLDSTATTLKPQRVIEKINEYYTHYTANVFRGIYLLSEEATAEYERARGEIARFIRAASPEEVIFTRNATESINLVAYSWGRLAVVKGNEIVTTIMEHHSNFVPWQQLAAENGITLKVWNIDANGQLDQNELEKIITRGTKLLAITAASNVLGTILPIKAIVEMVKRLNPKCLVLVDAAQAVPHLSVDVHAWGADFVAFSGHKMLGPTGIGVLWGKAELLEAMAPFNFGGEMITEVHVDKTVFQKIPHKFEAGTPHIAGAIGLGAAVDYLTNLRMEQVRQHEVELVSYAMKQLDMVSGLSYFGPRDPKERSGVIAFTLRGAHPHDIAQILDSENVYIRAGNHCAMPLHEYLGITATARASFYVYTTKEDIDKLIEGLEKVRRILK